MLRSARHSGLGLLAAFGIALFAGVRLPHTDDPHYIEFAGNRIAEIRQLSLLKGKTNTGRVPKFGKKFLAVMLRHPGGLLRPFLREARAEAASSAPQWGLDATA